MSFRQNGMPSSFFRCRILFPEYTDETLPLALRLVEVVVEVYMGSPSPSFAPPSAPPGVPASCGSSRKGWLLLGGSIALGVAAAAGGGGGTLVLGSSGSEASICWSEAMLGGFERSRLGVSDSCSDSLRATSDYHLLRKPACGWHMIITRHCSVCIRGDASGMNVTVGARV